MLIKIPIYFEVSGNPSTEILREFIKDLQVSLTCFLENDGSVVDTLNDARESESFPEISMIVDYEYMMSKILKPHPQVLEIPKKVPVKRKPRTVKKT
jgi:hypothetical protein